MSNFSGNKGKPAVEENKLFVGGLHWHTDEAKFKEYFEKFGTVLSAVIKREPKTRKSKCFGFIEFTNKDSIQRVLDHTAGHILDGKSIDPKQALPPGANTDVKCTKIFVGGVPTDMPKETLKEYFSHYGEVKEVSLSKDPAERRRGFVFVHFVHDTTVDEVVKKSFHMITSMGVEHRVEVKKAYQRDRSQPNDGNSRGGPFGGRGRASGGFDGGYGGYSGYGGYGGYPGYGGAGGFPYGGAGGYGNYPAPNPGGFGGFQGAQGMGYGGQGQGQGGFPQGQGQAGYGGQGQGGYNAQGQSGYGGQTQGGYGGQDQSGAYGGQGQGNYSGQGQSAAGYVGQGPSGGYGGQQGPGTGYGAGGQNGGYGVPPTGNTQGFNAGGSAGNYQQGGGPQRNQQGPGGPIRSNYHQGANTYHPYQR